MIVSRGLIFICSTCVAVSAFFCGYGLQASDTEDRLAFLQLEVDDANEGFSANVFCKCLLDPGDLSKRPAVIEKMQRVVVGGKGCRRIDGQYMISRGEESPLPMRESMLVTPVDCFYWRHQPMKNVNSHILRERVKGGFIPIHTLTVLKHPYLLSLCQQNSANIDTFDSATLTTKFKVLEEQELSDGRLRSLIAFTNNLAVIEITFSKDPDWAPEIVHFFLRGDKALPKDRPLEVGDVKAWNRYATTTTKWKELKEYDRTVPQSVTIAAEDEQGAHLLEYVFSDWKFDKDINQSLLDENQFAKEKILSAIDFDSLRSSFDESSALKR